MKRKMIWGRRLLGLFLAVTMVAGTLQEVKAEEALRPETEVETHTKAEVSAAVNEMYRLYNPNSGEHFYTANRTEKEQLVEVGWKYEGCAWYAPTSSNTPVYRLYNANAGDHHYTINAAEKDQLVGLGWKYEGVGWFSDDAAEIPLYRQYNPNARAGSHNYTRSLGENNALVSSGWRAEDIGWYGTRPEGITGVYSGYYTASQGRTGVTIRIYQSGDLLYANYEFYNLPGLTNNRDDGSYLCTVDENGTGTYDIKGIQWEKQPKDYYMMDWKNTTIADGVIDCKDGSYVLHCAIEGI